MKRRKMNNEMTIGLYDWTSMMTLDCPHNEKTTITASFLLTEEIVLDALKSKGIYVNAKQYKAPKQQLIDILQKGANNPNIYHSGIELELEEVKELKQETL